MEPFSLQGSGLILNELTLADAPDIARYCAEPVFERFMSTPWPYTLGDAEAFVGEYVPKAWANDSEWTWAIREEADGPLAGVIGLRLPSGMLGYWLGAPFRGRMIMSAAVQLVVEGALEHTDLAELRWEAHVGNVSSLRTVERAGFTYTGEAPGTILGRDGEAIPSWTARLTRTEASAPKYPVRSSWPV